MDSAFVGPEGYLTVKEREELAERLRDEEFFANFWEKMWTEKSSVEVREAVRRCTLKTPVHVRVSAMITKSLPHVYREDEVYDVPALHISIKDQIDARWKRHMPRLEVVAWEGYSHFLFMEDHERFNKCIERFLERFELLRG